MLKAGVAVFVLALAAALAAPVWIVQYPPLLDYPNHLARSFVLSHLHDPSYSFSRYYEAHWGPYPYLGMDLLLILFQQFLPVHIAGKLLLTLCLVAVPAAFWLFLRQVNPGNDELAIWALLVACSEFFLESFLAFQLSIAAGLLFLAFWFRWKQGITAKRWFLLLLLVIVVYFCHLIGFIIAGFVVTVACAVERRPRTLLLSWLLFAPGVALFVISGLGIHNGHDLHFRSFGDKVSEFVRTLFGGFSDNLTSLTLWGAAGCLILAAVRNRDLRLRKTSGMTAAALFVLYAALPYALGETFDIDVRVLPVFFLMLLTVADVGRSRARILGAIALVLFTARITSIAQTFRAEEPELVAISRGVQLIKPGSMVLPIVEPRQEDDPNRWPYEHFSAWTVTERGAFSPYLFDLPGQTPMRIFYDVYSPDAYWDSVYRNSDIDWAAVRRNYDYVWAYNVVRFDPDLDQIGTRIYSSGAFRLYKIDRPKRQGPGQTGDGRSGNRGN